MSREPGGQLPLDPVPDVQLIAGFEACTLTDFHHREHVRVAWLYLRECSLLEALKRFAVGLKRYATAKGCPDRYHETLTWAYMLLINERMGRTGRENDWSEFVAANEDLLDWDAPILDRYYEEETLRSELARKVFVLPDRSVV